MAERCAVGYNDDTGHSEDGRQAAVAPEAACPGSEKFLYLVLFVHEHGGSRVCEYTHVSRQRFFTHA